VSEAGPQRPSYDELALLVAGQAAKIVELQARIAELHMSAGATQKDPQRARQRVHAGCVARNRIIERSGGIGNGSRSSVGMSLMTEPVIARGQ
jgi:hypothetical protein